MFSCTGYFIKDCGCFAEDFRNPCAQFSFGSFISKIAARNDQVYLCNS